MNEFTTSFLLCFPMSEAVIWGNDEFDDDDFYINPHIQMMANHLIVPFPVCHLYQLYYDGPLKGGRDCHIFKSPEIGNRSLVLFDLHVYDKTDQHDLVYLGVKCQGKYVNRVRNCLKKFISSMRSNPVINPYEESASIEFLEELIKKT